MSDTLYSVKYHFGDQINVVRPHRSLRACIRDWRRCLRTARVGGDHSPITVAAYSNGKLRALNYAEHALVRACGSHFPKAYRPADC